MNIIKILGLKRGFPHNKMAPRPQKWPELTKKRPKSPQKYHVLFWHAVDPPDATLVNNPSNFIERSQLKLLGLKRRFPDHKMAPTTKAA